LNRGFIDDNKLSKVWTVAKCYDYE